MADKGLEQITVNGKVYEIYHEGHWPRDNETADKLFMYAQDKNLREGKRLHIKSFPERIVWIVAL